MKVFGDSLFMLQRVKIIYIEKKLANLSMSSQAYWSILKTFVDGKKIPITPPLLVNGKFFSNFSEKASFLTNFSANNASLTKQVVLFQNLIRIIQKTG